MSDEKYIVYHIQSNVVDSKVVFSCFSSPYCSVLCWWKRKAFQSVILGRSPPIRFLLLLPPEMGAFFGCNLRARDFIFNCDRNQAKNKLKKQLTALAIALTIELT